ncbi:MAG: N4-gp56 family major capsid protein [bacterium]
MADTTISTSNGGGTNDISQAMQDYFSRELLDTIEKTVVLDQFAMKSPLPAKGGGRNMTFFRYLEGDSSNVTQLTEGSTPTTKALELEKVEVDLQQYGQVLSISDIADATALFNNIEQATLRIGRDSALHLDSIIRAELFSNVTNVTDIFSGSTTSWGTSITAADASDWLDAATALKINAATPLDGGFIAVVGPQQARDLLADSEWQEAHHYAEPQARLRGEIGRMHGVRFIETTEPFIANDSASQYTYAAGGDTYGSVVIGAQAYGVPELSSQSTYSPKVYIVNGADKGDPLNQKILVGFKSFFAAKTIQPKHVARVYSKTGYSA